MNPLTPQDWRRLNPLQVGKYGEYLTKMEFVLLGCDVFTSEVDDHGIDFVVRTRSGTHFDVQVKTFRLKPGTTPYIYLEKSKHKLDPSLLLALVQLVDGQPPTLFLLQSKVDNKAHDLLEDRDYVGKKSDPEWGLTLSRKKLAALAERCAFHSTVGRLIEQASESATDEHR